MSAGQLRVGQVLWCVMARGREGFGVTVTKVGRKWAEIEGPLPADFKTKVNAVARQILEAGRVS